MRRAGFRPNATTGFPGAGKGALIFEVELLRIVDSAKLFQTPTQPGGGS